MITPKYGATFFQDFKVGDRVLPRLFPYSAIVRDVIIGNNWKIYDTNSEEIVPSLTFNMYLIEFEEQITSSVPKDALWAYSNEALQLQSDPSAQALKFQMLKVGDVVKPILHEKVAIVEDIFRSNKWEVYDIEKQALRHAETPDIYLAKFAEQNSQEISADTMWTYTDEQLIKL